MVLRWQRFQASFRHRRRQRQLRLVAVVLQFPATVLGLDSFLPSQQRYSVRHLPLYPILRFQGRAPQFSQVFSQSSRRSRPVARGEVVAADHLELNGQAADEGRVLLK